MLLLSIDNIYVPFHHFCSATIQKFVDLIRQINTDLIDLYYYTYLDTRFDFNLKESYQVQYIAFVELCSILLSYVVYNILIYVFYVATKLISFALLTIIFNTKPSVILNYMTTLCFFQTFQYLIRDFSSFL